jgi:hypothetical protein
MFPVPEAAQELPALAAQVHLNLAPDSCAGSGSLTSTRSMAGPPTGQ